jgi:hypothetical protein
MLNMNPGLKEITHSITGGALAAQGKINAIPSDPPSSESLTKIQVTGCPTPAPSQYARPSAST